MSISKGARIETLEAQLGAARAFIQHVADGDSKDYTDNYQRAEAILALIDHPNPAPTPEPMVAANAYEKGLKDALAIIASIGYGKNHDVDEGHEDAYRAIEEYYADWKDHPTPAPTPEAVAGWQPIETAPSEHLIFHGNTRHDARTVFTGWKAQNGRYYADNGDSVKPTHWMPLPSPPSDPAPAPTPSLDDVVKAALKWAAGRVGSLWCERLYAAASDPDTRAAIIKTVK